MPTENRSSSNHGTRTFTLDSLTAALEQVQALHEISADLIAESVFGQPAQQGQGEPVAWLTKTLKGSLAGTLGFVRSYQKLNSDLYEGPFPVFRNANPAKVERLHQKVSDLTVSGHQEYMRCEKMRAQLAEAQALLRRIAGADHQDSMRAIGEAAALSASAEPSAPLRYFDMNLVVSGNMPDDKVHLVGGEGGARKLVLPSALAKKGFSEIRQQHYEELMQRREARADVRASRERSAPKCKFCGGDGYHHEPCSPGVDCTACNGTGIQQGADLDAWYEAHLRKISAAPSAPAEIDEPTCKGAWQLGTACGKCRRCKENPPT